MSAKGAEGILKAAGKVSDAKPLDLDAKKATEPAAKPAPKRAKKAVRGTARPTVTDEDVRSKLSDAKKADEDAPRAQKAGEAVGRAVGKPIGTGLSMGNEAAGFILGLIVWGWVVRPFLVKGLPGVKAVWMAKFFNKKPDGTELP